MIYILPNGDATFSFMVLALVNQFLFVETILSNFLVNVSVILSRLENY